MSQAPKPGLQQDPLLPLEVAGVQTCGPCTLLCGGCSSNPQSYSEPSPAPTLMPSNRDSALRGRRARSVRRDLMGPSSE